MKNFITLTETHNKPKKITLHVDYIVEFGEVENCSHKSYVRTTLNNLYWILEDVKEIELRIKKSRK